MKRCNIFTSIRHILISSIIAVPGLLHAQSGISGSTVSGVDFKPKPADAVKIPVEPEEERNTRPRPKMKYERKLVGMQVAPAKITLTAPGFKPKLDELNRHYFKGGFGNYADLYWEYIFNTRRDRNNLFAARAMHNSGNGPIGSSRFSTNDFSAYGKKLVGKFVFDGDLGYVRNVNRYYAVPGDKVYPTDSIRQVFNILNIRGGVSNNAASDSALHFGAKAGYTRLMDIQSNNESDLNLSANAFQLLGFGKIQINGDYHKYWYNLTDTSNNRSLLRIEPAFLGTFRVFHFKLGFKTATQTDFDGSRFSFYPDLAANFDLLKDKFTIFGEMTGGITPVTYRSIALENPWISTPSSFRNTNTLNEIKGGFKGSFGNAGAAYYTFALGQSTLRDWYFYANDSADRRKLLVIYDTGNVSRLNVHAELGYKIDRHLELSTNFDYNNYSMGILRQAYYRPPIFWNVKALYNLDNKFVVAGDVYYSGARMATVFGSNEDVKLKGFVDANLNLQYELQNVKGVRLYLDFKNFLASKYDLYLYYPARRFQVSGGVILHFL